MALSIPAFVNAHKPLSGSLLGLALLAFAPAPAHAALNIPITVNLSEAVTVTGTPQIAVDVGGTTRYATYTSGTGTNALTFTLAPQAGDVDLDGVTVSSPIQLNGGTIKDTKGNNATLTFTPPNTANVKVNYPSLGMDFVYDADGRYTLNGTPYNDLPSFLSGAGGSFTRASIGTYFDSSGNLQTATANTPRFDYDPVTHTAKGILIEESRVNLLTYSMVMNTAPWNLARATVQLAATTSPDGTLDGIKLRNNGTTGGVYAGYWRTYTANQTYTYSIFAKKSEVSSIVIPIYASVGWLADGNVSFDLNNGTATPSGTGISSYKITSLPNGWYRCSITATFGPTDTYGQYPVTMLGTNPVDSTSGTYLWGAQLEQAPFATSYIPTTTAAVTRAADALSIPIGAWFNTTNSSFTATAESFGMSSGKWPGIVDFYLSGTERFGSYYNASGISVISEQRSSGSTKMSSKSGSWGNVQVKASASFDTSGTHLSVNGTSSILSASGGFPSGLTTMRVGRFDDYLNGHLSSIKYYPAHVPDTQLQLLTQ